jgi:hypothetical protein
MMRITGGMVAVVLIAVAALVVGIIVWLDNESVRITDAEQDRLVGSCNRSYDYANPGLCTAWIAGMVDWAEDRDMGYAALAETVRDELEELDEEAEHGCVVLGPGSMEPPVCDS